MHFLFPFSQSYFQECLLLFFLLRLRCPNSKHPFTFHFWHALKNAGFVQPLCEFQQKQFAPLLELDSAPFELHVSLHLVAVFQKFLCVLCFEIEIMIISIWCKAYFFYFA